MPTTLHTLTGEPDEPDRPAPAASEPYWRHQTWRPPRYRDNTGPHADPTTPAAPPPPPQQASRRTVRCSVSPGTAAPTHRHETGGRTGAPAGHPPGAPACRLTRAPPCPTVPNHPGRTP